MRKEDLTSQQIRDLNIFNLLLECDGWVDDEDVENRLDQGEDVNPEGVRNCANGKARLLARYHAPVSMISLRISDLLSKEKVQFHFLFDDRPERILEWLVQHSDELSMENYPEVLKEANGRCEMILLEVSESEIYEVKPPSRKGNQ
ncbi:MAG: hypothetical protein AAGI38_17595 [Bacteroidota bacterium]